MIEAVGEGVTAFKAGDRVYSAATVSGAYAEKVLVDVANTYLLPANVGFSAGAGINVPYATAYRALMLRAKGVQPGETLLVHGASGGVGLAATQIARALGMNVYGTASTDAGQDAVRAAGAIQVFNHKTPAIWSRRKRRRRAARASM